jgi:soluble lytic murein transglycosylase-like protein
MARTKTSHETGFPSRFTPVNPNSRSITVAIILSLLIAISIYCRPLFSQVYKRVHKDGTIEFYNKNDTTAAKSGRRTVESKYDRIIEKLSAKYGIDPFLIKCIIKIESNFNPDAVSVAGAMGLMQIMQDTADHYHLENPFDPEKNIETGIRHLKQLLTFFKNDLLLAVAAYHAGLSRVKKNMSLPPIQSTINYVDNVMRLYTGKSSYSEYAVKRLYKKIERDGTVLIYSR